MQLIGGRELLAGALLQGWGHRPAELGAFPVDVILGTCLRSVEQFGMSR